MQALNTPLLKHRTGLYVTTSVPMVHATNKPDNINPINFYWEEAWFLLENQVLADTKLNMCNVSYLTQS